MFGYKRVFLIVTLVFFASPSTSLGASYVVADVETMPGQVPAGTYSLDVAILTEDGRSAQVDLAIEGKRADRWYPISSVTIRN